MQTDTMAFTAVYLKAKYGYVGFIEELPGVNSHGATLEEARDKLREVVEAVFAAERENCRELLAGKDTVREDLLITFSPQKHFESKAIALPPRGFPKDGIKADRKATVR